MPNARNVAKVGAYAEIFLLGLSLFGWTPPEQHQQLAAAAKS
jgi:hypothetical protein